MHIYPAFLLSFFNILYFIRENCKLFEGTIHEKQWKTALPWHVLLFLILCTKRMVTLIIISGYEDLAMSYS